MLKIVSPIPSSIGMVGGYNPQDKDSEAYKFVARFGMYWRLLRRESKTYVLFDKEDKVCFTLQGDEIAVYPWVTKKEFLDSWNGDAAVISGNAVYRSIDPKFKHHYLQVLELIKEFDIDRE